jgi:hypothetical protein
MTIVEGVVASMVLTIGALGVLQVFDAGTRNTYRTEQSQVVNDRLQAELEEIRQLPYAEVGLTSQPTALSDSNHPRWRVSGTRYATGRDGTALKEMVFNSGAIPGGGTVTGGAVDPGPEHFDTGDVSGDIYRFVTWDTDPNCTQCRSGALKRVIVAATIDDTSVVADRAFQEVQTQIVDPEAEPSTNPVEDDDEIPSATAQFWLTDTPCNQANRIPATADHLAHNTRARCADGLQTGNTRGAPDLMYIDGPSLDPNYPPTGQPLYDYATDLEPTDPNSDDGLQMVGANSDSCLLEPVLSVLDLRRALEGILAPLGVGAVVNATDGLLSVVTSEDNKHLRTHTWLSPPISGNGGVLLGKGTLELFTKTVNGQSYRGEVCATLFVRQDVTIPKCLATLPLLGCTSVGQQVIEADLPVVNVGAATSTGGVQCQQGLNLTYFRCSKDPWPTTWSKLSIPLDFVGVNAAGAVSPIVLPPNSRIGLTVMIKKGGTAGQGLEFMYDSVGYESRLELTTNKILAF